MIGTAAKWGSVCALSLAFASATAQAQIAKNEAAKSPWGPADEIGTLNMMTDTSRFEVLKQVIGGKVYDLAVDLFVGMPTCCAPFGDPTFQIWMTHIPARGKGKELLSYSGDGVSMYTHTGTHIGLVLGEVLLKCVVAGEYKRIYADTR